MVAKKSLLRFFLLVIPFAVCAVIGTLLADLTDETWLVAVGVGVGILIFSAIGTYIEARKPKFLYYILSEF